MNYEEVDEIIENRLHRDNNIYLMNSEDFFVHMCCHLYKEACNASWALLGNDLNIIKFCDIREFMHSEITEEKWKVICEMAIKKGYQRAIYFAIYVGEQLYGKMCCFDYKKELGVQNDEFLYEYGEREYGMKLKWRDSFMNRLFEGSCDEMDLKNGHFPLIK